MATGKLGANDLSATTNTTVYTCPADTYAVVAINICNRGSNATAVRIAVADGDSPGAAEYIEYDVGVPPKGVIERTGVVVGADQRIVVRSSAVDVNAIAYGIVTSTA